MNFTNIHADVITYISYYLPIRSIINLWLTGNRPLQATMAQAQIALNLDPKLNLLRWPSSVISNIHSIQSIQTNVGSDFNYHRSSFLWKGFDVNHIKGPQLIKLHMVAISYCLRLLCDLPYTYQLPNQENVTAVTDLLDLDSLFPNLKELTLVGADPDFDAPPIVLSAPTFSNLPRKLEKFHMNYWLRNRQDPVLLDIVSLYYMPPTLQELNLVVNYLGPFLSKECFKRVITIGVNIHEAACASLIHRRSDVLMPPNLRCLKFEGHPSVNPAQISLYNPFGKVIKSMNSSHTKQLLDLQSTPEVRPNSDSIMSYLRHFFSRVGFYPSSLELIHFTFPRVDADIYAPDLPNLKSGTGLSIERIPLNFPIHLTSLEAQISNSFKGSLIDLFRSLPDGIQTLLLHGRPLGLLSDDDKIELWKAMPRSVTRINDYFTGSHLVEAIKHIPLGIEELTVQNGWVVNFCPKNSRIRRVIDTTYQPKFVEDGTNTENCQHHNDDTTLFPGRQIEKYHSQFDSNWKWRTLPSTLQDLRITGELYATSSMLIDHRDVAGFLQFPSCLSRLELQCEFPYQWLNILPPTITFLTTSAITSISDLSTNQSEKEGEKKAKESQNLGGQPSKDPPIVLPPHLTEFNSLVTWSPKYLHSTNSDKAWSDLWEIQLVEAFPTTLRQLSFQFDPPEVDSDVEIPSIPQSSYLTPGRGVAIGVDFATSRLFHFLSPTMTSLGIQVDYINNEHISMLPRNLSTLHIRSRLEDLDVETPTLLPKSITDLSLPMGISLLECDESEFIKRLPPLLQFLDFDVEYKSPHSMADKRLSMIHLFHSSQSQSQSWSLRM